MTNLSRGRRVAVMTAMVVVFGVAGACTTSQSSDGESGSCAYRVMYDGHIYTDWNGDSVAGDKQVGRARVLRCSDSNGEGDQTITATGERLSAYLIDGVDSQWAIAVGGSAGRALIVVAEGVDTPASIMKKLGQ